MTTEAFNKKKDFRGNEIIKMKSGCTKVFSCVHIHCIYDSIIHLSNSKQNLIFLRFSCVAIFVIKNGLQNWIDNLESPFLIFTIF